MRYAFFIVLASFGLIVPSAHSLSKEQQTFTTTFSLPLEHKTILDPLFSALNITAFISRPGLDENTLRKHALDHGFKPLKVYFRAPTRRRPGSAKLIVIHPLLKNCIIKLDIPLPCIGKKKSRLCRNLSRIMGSDKIRTFAQRNKLTYVIAPRKYLYHIPGQPFELYDCNYAVIVEQFSILSPLENKEAFKKVPRELLEEVLKVINEVGFYDAHNENICLTTDGFVAFIDTEDRRGYWKSTTPFTWFNGLRKMINSLIGKAKFCKRNPAIKRSMFSPESICIALNIA